MLKKILMALSIILDIAMKVIKLVKEIISMKKEKKRSQPKRENLGRSIQRPPRPGGSSPQTIRRKMRIQHGYGNDAPSMTVCEREAWHRSRHRAGPGQSLHRDRRLIHQESYGEKTVREVNPPGTRDRSGLRRKRSARGGRDQEIARSSSKVRGSSLPHYLNELEKERRTRHRKDTRSLKEKKQLPVVLDDESRQEPQRFIELTWSESGSNFQSLPRDEATGFSQKVWTTNSSGLVVMRR